MKSEVKNVCAAEEVEFTVPRSRVPFNKPYVTGRELAYVEQAFANFHLSGNGMFTEKCQRWLEAATGSPKSFLTHSGTGALEMSAILADIKDGDEVIMPSFTFVTTASAFVLRGAVPVFIDIRPDTLNIDEKLICRAITKKTKAIVPVHYAGVSCDMDSICQIAADHNLIVIEDAAHALKSSYKNLPVGCRGDMAAFSFHETKNIIAGEAGALLINNERLIERAHIVWEKGTNRREFYMGQTDKYTWKELGSSFPASELTAAFLFAQMEAADAITERRINIWNQYHHGFERLAKKGVVERPAEWSDRQRNGHMYYLLLDSEQTRNKLLEYLNRREISAVFHYIPLHSSPAGQLYGRSHGELLHTTNISGRLLRMPLWVELPDKTIVEIVDFVEKFFAHI